MKRWIICIDVPFWVSALGSNHGDWLKLLSLLDEVAMPDNQLLYRDEIKQLVKEMPDEQWLLESKLSKISTVGYSTDEKAKYVKSKPDVTLGITNAVQKNEISCQTAYLYKRVGSLPRPIMAAQRLNDNEVVLTKDGKHARKVYVCGVGNGDIQSRIDGLFPELDQAKHFQFERHIAKGKIASTFSLYDKQNEKPAKALLREAFLHYEGEDLPANSLWAKDETHGCYVKFMHSGNNKYHGFDEINLDKVPQDVKDIFG